MLSQPALHSLVLVRLLTIKIPLRRFLFFEYLSLSVFTYYGIFSISITPNMPVRCRWQCHSSSGFLCRRTFVQECSSFRTTASALPCTANYASILAQVAYMISGMIYFMWSLHCGFIIPEPSYPGWWIWLYYINPMSWILYGFVVSQLGDVTSTFVQVLHADLLPLALCCRPEQCCTCASPASYCPSAIQHRMSPSFPLCRHWTLRHGNVPTSGVSQRQACMWSASNPCHELHTPLAAQDDGTVIQVNEYLRQHFNYKHNTLGVAVAVLFGYIAIFGCAHGTPAGSIDRPWH